MPNLDFKEQIGTFAGFVRYSLLRFSHDGCLRVAASLSYSCLLALVPMLAIGLGLLSLFPTFETLQDDIQSLISKNFLPDAGLQIQDQMGSFVDNARQTTGLGLVALGVTAILLLSTIAGAFNDIWRITRPRPLFTRLVIYWAVLTLGPLLVGASISISSYGFAMVQWSSVEDYGASFFVGKVLPMVLSALGFATLYIVVPAQRVRWSHALIGAVVAAVLFEVLKRGFGLYIRQSSSYEAIYGAISTIPIFLIWMYLSWAVILYGAVVTASLPEWRAEKRFGGTVRSPGATLSLALAILQRLQVAAREGHVWRESKLGQGLPVGPEHLSVAINLLQDAGYVARTGPRLVLARDLSSVTLNDLVAALNLELGDTEGWPEPVQKIIGSLAEKGTPAGEGNIRELFDQAAAATPLFIGRGA
ncbi:MAG: YihY family inner membrane protein [Pseudomonadota bacterium]